MEKNDKNLEILSKIIEEFKDDDELLNIITNILEKLNELDPIWNDSINQILQISPTKKFISKIKLFFKNIKYKNYLLIINLLLESFDIIEDFSDNIKEKSFYVILKELLFILNENSVSFQQNYTNGLQFLKKFRLTIIS